MDQEFRPELQFAVDQGEGGGVVAGEAVPLPEFGGEMGAFGNFEAQIQGAGGGRGADGGIAGVGKGAGLPVAEAGGVVGVAAEGGGFGCSVCKGEGANMSASLALSLIVYEFNFFLARVLFCGIGLQLTGGKGLT